MCIRDRAKEVFSHCALFQAAACHTEGRPDYSDTTVTDFGSSLIVNLPPWTVAEFGFIPIKLASISTALFGSMLVSPNQSLPDVSLAAIASTRGSVMSPFV